MFCVLPYMLLTSQCSHLKHAMWRSIGSFTACYWGYSLIVNQWLDDIQDWRITWLLHYLEVMYSRQSSSFWDRTAKKATLQWVWVTSGFRATSTGVLEQLLKNMRQKQFMQTVAWLASWQAVSEYKMCMTPNKCHVVKERRQKNPKIATDLIIKLIIKAFLPCIFIHIL